MNTPNIEELRRLEAEEEARDVAWIEAMIAQGDVWSAANFAKSMGLSEHVPKLVYETWQAGRFAESDLHEAIRAAWVFNRAPVAALSEVKWVRLFRAAGFVSASANYATIDRDGTRTETAPAFEHVIDKPTGPVTVWRGAGLDTGGRGMSWTVHRDVAINFAQEVARNSIEAAIWRTVVPPDAVLAMFGDERETEVVVDPTMLSDQIALDEAIPAEQADPNAWLERVQTTRRAK
jgi:hypothetical protein